IRHRLQPLTKNVYCDHQPRIKKLSNVQHLHTPIRAHLKDDTDILPVIEQLHPTPAVGGYPRKDAMEYIRELEDFERGWYAGPVGWMTPSGSGEFAVAIRSGLLSEDEAHFFAGCGIVADSNPKEEWEETNLKLSPMLSALNYD
ncbi:MAG TPA: chorismate-binding protein, partial [Fodinibius sp.]|nr:chorismate-binding protein [Fodinibius sp.]